MIETFGQLLAEWRWLRDYSQSELGRASGVDATFISKLEGGAGASVEVVGRLERALQLSHRETALFYLMAGFAPPHWRELFGLDHLRQIAEQPLTPRAARQKPTRLKQVV